MTPFVESILIWGIWILIPIFLDGVGALLRVSAVLFFKRAAPSYVYEDSELPLVSLIVPAYNEESIIERCVNSLKVQDYPDDKTEIIVVDDGSCDLTSEVMESVLHGGGSNIVKIDGEYVVVHDFLGKVRFIKNDDNHGKHFVLNLGILHSHGDIVMTIDSDTVLDINAVRNMVVYLMDNPEKAAACGVIETDSRLIEQLDQDGFAIDDKNGLPKQKRLTFTESLLSHCQFLEYVNSFRLGRFYQSKMHIENMLSGAFTAFKRDALEDKDVVYSNLTVSEDFDVSLDLRQDNREIGFSPDAKAWVEPTLDLQSLYMQRLRWRRGQLEVVGAHKNMVGSGKYGMIGRIGLPGMLVIDHTLAFPRLIWTFLLMFFPLYGFSQQLVAMFFVMIYVFYVLFDVVQTAAAYKIADSSSRNSILDSFHYVLLLPVYRIIVFYFRMSGYLVVFKDPQGW